MLETGLKLLPIVVMFVLGFVGRRQGYLQARHAGQFLRLVAMGIYLDLHRLWDRQVMAILLLKPGQGMLIGLGLVALFRLEAMIKTTVILGCMAPVGFNTLIYAQREKLDNEFAAHIASLTVLLGSLYMPLLIFVLY